MPSTRSHPDPRLAAAGLLASAVLTASCQTTNSNTCTARAENEYQRCLYPAVMSTPEAGRGLEPERGERSQACQISKKQALAQCMPAPDAPVPDLQPDAGTVAP